MGLHADLISTDIHVIHSFTYADATSRNAAVVVSTDIGKVARQSDNNAYYILIDTTPTWSQIDSSGFDTFLEMTDTPASFVGNTGRVVEVNAGETALQFGQQLRATDSPTFLQVSVGNTGLVVGASTPFSDSAGVLTLQNIDALDAITESTIESAIDTLANLTSIQGQAVTLSGSLTVESASVLNQDLTTDANVSFNDLTLAGNLTISGTVDGIDIATDVPLNTTHRSSDGSDHAFLDQSVTILSTPTFLKAVIGTTVTSDGTLHVHKATAGGVTASSVADGIVVEDSTNTGISILTPDASVGRVVFGSPSDPFGAFMTWSFSGSDFAMGTSKIGANFRLTSDEESTNLTLSGGVGSELATFAKDVTITGQIKIIGGIPALDRVLTSIDLDGNAEWRVLPQSVGWIAAGSTVSLNDPADSVRIGTGTGVDSKLHVISGSAGTVTAFVGTIATFESSGAGYLSILTPDVSTSGILFGEPSSNLAGGIFYNDPGSPDGFQFRVNGNSTKMVIESDGKVGIGTTNPDVTSILHLNSTTKGFLPPRMTTVERDAISSPLAGLKVHNTTVDKSEVFTGTSWKTVLTEDLGQVVVQETFASSNVRFFGELALPAAQGWTDLPTGPATIDLVTQIVFGESKQVVRHNDDTGTGSTTSQITLTTQNWIDIDAFGASYGGTARLDTVDGGSGFFSGLQANAAENPLATGNRRYGILFGSNAGSLQLKEADNTGNVVIMDGTGGNPAVLFDEWFNWECVVPAGLGAAQFYINGILTTFVPVFGVNGGGLGTRVLVSSGSTSGSNRIVYHDNFGVTIFEESATKTLAATTMSADVAQVNIPEGKRDYTVILPDGNVRPIGAVLRLVANNISGLITLTNQDVAVPEILYNGLRTEVINVFVREVIEGINTVNSGNVYIGFKAEDVDRSSSIFAQLHSIIDQIPTDVNPTVITYTNHDAINGIGHSTTINTGELEILPGFEGTYFVMAQPQVGKDSGGTKVDFDMFLQVDRGAGFVDEPNSNIKLTIKDSDITDVIVSAITIQLQVGDKIRMMQAVSNAVVGMGLKNTDPVVGPPSVPRTPSIIFTMYRVGGI